MQKNEWDALWRDDLLRNTRDFAMMRKDICTSCEHWDGRCIKWVPVIGANEPWVGFHGVCPIGRWTAGRRKSPKHRSKTGQTE